MLKHRFLILSLTFLFSLAGLVSAFAHCFLDHALPTVSSVEIPVSVSCLDGLDHPFLAKVDQRDKRIYFSKTEKRPADIHPKVLLPLENVYLTGLRPAVSILDPKSVPIYQMKNVYRI